uniref:Uncharacterized protein n=1 Tax=Romanomermis culicivorax TaxID=13658 RepID=A0A915K051_ROMCU
MFLRCESGQFLVPAIAGFSAQDDVPDVIQWYTVPEQYDKNDKWYLSVMSAFYDYRIGKVVVLLAS